jgi:dTDP-4-amino-4,6-dideoxygalactose transaminase
LTSTLAVDGGSPVRSDFLVFGKPCLEEAEIQEVIDTLRSGWLGTGPKTARFEEMFAEYAGTRHAVAVSSCTGALHLALLTLGLQPGDEVITTPLTFVATANVIQYVGAVPVFADVDPKTHTLDPAAVEAAITSRTKAVLPVHLHGRPCEMDSILDVADRHGLAVVGDAAHAIEATLNGVKIGSLGDLACFSFYATKNVCTGEGGMITTDDANRAERLRTLRLHGMSRDAWRRFGERGHARSEVAELGFKENFTDMQASLGIHQLGRVEQNLVRRRTIWDRYNDAFDALPYFETPSANVANGRHALHIYALTLRVDELSIDRDGFLDALQAENIGCGIHYLPVHLQPYYRSRFGFSEGAFPVAESIGARTLSLPLSPCLTDSDVEDVIDAVNKVATAFAGVETVGDLRHGRSRT